MQDSTIFNAELNADTFYLRPWRIEDAQWYVESRDEEVFRWTSENRDLTVEEARSNIDKYRYHPDGIGRAIVGKDNHELLGNIALSFQENNRKSAEIMYWLSPEGRGRGIATNAVKLFCKWAFDSLGLERMTLKTNVGNTRSQLVAKRAGFRRQKTDNIDGKNSDRMWFELINRADFSVPKHYL